MKVGVTTKYKVFKKVIRWRVFIDFCAKVQKWQFLEVLTLWNTFCHRERGEPSVD